MALPGIFLPIFQPPYGDISCFLRENEHNNGLYNLNYFIFSKNKDSTWTYTVPFVFNAFEKKFLLTAIHTFDDKTSNLIQIGNTNNKIIEKLNSSVRTRIIDPSKYTVDQIMSASDGKTVFLYYDLEIN